MEEEGYCAGIPCRISGRDVTSIVAIMEEWWTSKPTMNTMWCPVFTLCRTRVPDDASGVRLKLNSPLRRLHPVSLGLIRDGRRRFRVISACSRRVSHWFKGKSGYVLQIPATKWFLKVRIPLSAAFRLWLCGGTSWKSTDFYCMLCWSTEDASLSSSCNSGVRAWIES